MRDEETDRESGPLALENCHKFLTTIPRTKFWQMKKILNNEVK